MKHRGVQYTLVQGVGRHIWKWSVSFGADNPATGQPATKAEACRSRARN
jgi:hypothetical protein